MAMGPLSPSPDVAPRSASKNSRRLDKPVRASVLAMRILSAASSTASLWAPTRRSKSRAEVTTIAARKPPTSMRSTAMIVAEGSPVTASSTRKDGRVMPPIISAVFGDCARANMQMMSPMATA